MKLVFALFLTVFSAQAFSQHENHKGHGHGHDHQASAEIKNDHIVVKVKGMVCAFCAQGIEKKFNEKSEVKSTKVDLDRMEVLITLHEGKKLDEATIRKVITDAGFAFEGIKK